MGWFSKKPKGTPVWDGHTLTREQLNAMRQQRPTGHWVCERCNDEWNTRRQVPEDWARLKEGPHVCPSCGSYAYTHPA